MKTSAKILQIVPHSPGTPGDGVGDYATTLAQELSRLCGCETVFVTGGSVAAQQCDHVILHYVNYGYQKRGVPLRLLRELRALRRRGLGKLLTIFHELYASGSWRQSAFWLRPLQIHIARSIAEMSDACLVSSSALRAQLGQLAPSVPILVRPVFSNFGEPRLAPAQIASRDPRRWVICGGTTLVERSLGSFLSRRNLICETFAPRELIVLGGSDRAAVRQLLANQSQIDARYFPNIEAATASELLSSAAFGWIDYFTHKNAPSGAILKSTAFAAYCAHGVIAVAPRSGDGIELQGDRLPAPFFVSESNANLPAASERPKIAQSIYDWYQRNASSAELARVVAQTLRLLP